MKLIHKKDMLKLNHEVVFHYYNGGYPCDLSIYGQSLGERDFIYQMLIGSFDSSGSDESMDMICMAERDNNFDIPVDYESGSRDGLFEDDSRYYVLSKNDLRQLIDRLSITYNQMPDDI